MFQRTVHIARASIVALLLAAAANAGAAEWAWTRPDGTPAGWAGTRARFTPDGSAILLSSPRTGTAGSWLQRIDAQGNVAWLRAIAENTAPAWTSAIDIDVPGSVCVASSTEPTGRVWLRCFTLAAGVVTIDRTYTVPGFVYQLRKLDAGGWAIATSESCGDLDCNRILRLDAANAVARVDLHVGPRYTQFNLSANGDAVAGIGDTTFHRIRVDGSTQDVDATTLVPGYPLPSGILESSESYLRFRDAQQQSSVLVALDDLTTVRWSRPWDGSYFFRREGGDAISLPGYDERLVVLDAATGATRWTAQPPYGGTFLQNLADRAIDPSGDVVLVTSRPGEIDVHALDRATGAGIDDAGRRIATTHTYIVATVVDPQGDLHVITNLRESASTNRYAVHALADANLRATVFRNDFE